MIYSLRNRKNNDNIDSSKVQRKSRRLPNSNAKSDIRYTSWNPLDPTDPMKNEETLSYSPPTNKRVHFSGEPYPPAKPMYPIEPKNPTVFVARESKSKPEIDRIYGTEEMNYMHYEPKTRTIKSFKRSGNKRVVKFVKKLSKKKLEKSDNRIPSNPFTTTDTLDENIQKNFLAQNQHLSESVLQYLLTTNPSMIRDLAIPKSSSVFVPPKSTEISRVDDLSSLNRFPKNKSPTTHHSQKSNDLSSNNVLAHKLGLTKQFPETTERVVFSRSNSRSKLQARQSVEHHDYFKPTDIESLASQSASPTANRLSELLQIFKFVDATEPPSTTPNPVTLMPGFR